MIRLAVPLLLVFAGLLVAADPAAVAEAVRTAASRPHPRLIVTEAVEARIRERLRTDSGMRDFFERIRRDADSLLPAPPNERKQVGRRLLYVSRDVLSRVLRLALVYRLTGEKKYLDRAEVEMLAAAGFRDWNPSHYLDVAEMSAGLAFGYDWLYHDLSTASRQTIRGALIEKGLGTYEGRAATNNWNDVCNGGMMMAALAVAGDHPELAAATLQKALDLWPIALETYAPEGGHPEGPGWYWSYATLYAVPVIASLESAAGTDFGIAESYPGFMAGASFYLHMHGPTGKYFNFSDSGGGEPALAPQTLWFANRLKEPSLLWQQARLLGTAGARGRIDPLALAWWPESLDVPPPKVLHYHTGGITPAASHRSSWTSPDASFIGLKGGRGNGPHGHLDIGSFIFESDGVRWAIDLGAESYHGIESRGMSLWGRTQDAQRWTVFRLNNFSHSTLTINGELQRVTGQGVLTRTAPEYTVMDLTTMYQPALKQASRGVRLLPDRRAIIQDEIAAGPGDVTVRWAMLTPAEVSLNGAQAQLARNGKTLELAVIEPDNARLELFPSDPPPAEYDSPNPGTVLVGFRASFPSGKRGRLVVSLTPGSTTGAGKAAVQPLAEWD